MFFETNSVLSIWAHFWNAILSFVDPSTTVLIDSAEDFTLCSYTYVSNSIILWTLSKSVSKYI